MLTIIKTLKLIDSFSKLVRGWNFGEGVAASPISLRQSKSALILAYSSGIKEFEAFPGVDGEIQLCCYKGDDTLEITFEINGLVTVCFEEADERLFYKKDISLDETIKILKDFAYNKCRLYALSTSRYTTAKRKNVSQVWLLDPHQATAASPSLIRIVPSETAGQFATTLSDIIPESQERQLYFGKFPTIQSLPCPV
jgi:hypothetical protein